VLGLLGWFACGRLAWCQEALPPLSLPAPAPSPAAAGSQRPGETTPPPDTSQAEDPLVTRLRMLRGELSNNATELERTREKQDKAPDQKELERLKKQVDLLQKQIEVLQKLVDLLVDQLKKQPPAGPAFAKLQTQTATLEARSQQAAQRDQDLAHAVDDLHERADAEQRAGPRLPATLKELFLPTQTNESPLSIYGVLAFSYLKENGKTGGFQFGELSPQFLLQLNDRFLLEGEISVGPNGSVSIGRAQVDVIVNDWLTIIGGNFESPIGFFNERLNHPWFNKFPDTAVFFRQVSPGDLLLLGLQARGSTYLGSSPVKLEYNAYVSNGLENNVANPTLTDVANLQSLENTYNVVANDLAFGGRLGLWIPEIGLTAGVSGFHNGDYLPGGEDGLNLWQLDAGYRHGNWDLRFEYAEMYQHATSFIGNNIHREGAYAQVAYRPYDAPCKYLEKTELAFRYSYARFRGIDPTALDLGAFGSAVDVPVNRNQYTFGINYYFYPAMVLKFAYEINHEIGPVQLHDNVFQTQFAWSF
jgi:hypothetical protein